MNKVCTVVSEPSSWAGLAAIFQAATYLFPQYDGALHALTAAAGAVAVAMRENNP